VIQSWTHGVRSGLKAIHAGTNRGELYDVNVLSTQRVGNRARLTQLRKQKNGLVVWVSSSAQRRNTLILRLFAAKAAGTAWSVDLCQSELDAGV